MNKVLSIHWGFSYGGVAKYAITIEKTADISRLELRSLCILSTKREVDRDGLSNLKSVVLAVSSPIQLSWILKVRKAIHAEAPDALLTHGFNAHLVSFLACNTSSKIQRLATYHGRYHPTTSAKKWVSPVYNAFTFWYLRRKANAVLCVAQFCADDLTDHGVDREKITVVHNGIPDFCIDPESRFARRAEWGIEPEHLVVGIASRLESIKGLDSLIDAVALVSSDYPEVRLVMVGDGSQRNSLEKRAIIKGVGHQVVFAGMRNDVADCLSAMDIFALPSLSEAHSIGLLEAMRAGLPIVATDVGGNTESIRDGQEGLIVKPADVAGLAKALRSLLGDRDLRTGLGVAARQRYSRDFSEQAMLKKTAQWLMRACDD